MDISDHHQAANVRRVWTQASFARATPALLALAADASIMTIIWKIASPDESFGVSADPPYASKESPSY